MYCGEKLPPPASETAAPPEAMCLGYFSEEESLLHPQAAINRHYLHSMRIINAYASRVTYSTNEFKERVYMAHWKIIDRSKWAEAGGLVVLDGS